VKQYRFRRDRYILDAWETDHRSGAADMSTATEIFFDLVRDHANPSAAQAAPETALGDVVGLMATGKASAVVVVDTDRRIAGIVTEQDIVRRAAFAADPAQPVRDVMSRPVHCIGEDEHLFIAIARMRRLGHRHMPIVDGDGRLAGILDLHHTMAHAASDLIGRIEELTREDSIDGMHEIKAAQVGIAEDLLTDNVTTGDIQSLLSHVNNDIYRRIADMNVSAMADEGKPAPPVEFSVIVMGSGGRGENFLVPDQDYGFVLADYADELRDEVDPWFVDLATRMSRDLDAVGLPYCKGKVMATNPMWRKTISGWKDQVDEWNRRAYAIPLLDFDIFFDFRICRGDPRLAAELRRHVTRVTTGNEPFLRALYGFDRDHGTARGWFGRFATEAKDPVHKGKINLKLHGLLPLIEGARMFALRDGVEATGTLARLLAAHGSGVLDDDEHEYLVAAHQTLGELLLRRQFADFRAGLPVSGFVHPNTLSRRDRARLREAFKAIEDLRARMKVEFGGEIF
jgi:signal-transduction protein with cAMP-binding, CBS, and nucleotidyltransferase domain